MMTVFNFKYIRRPIVYYYAASHIIRTILSGSQVMHNQLIVHGFTKYGAVQRAPRNLKGSAADLKVFAQQ